MAVMSGTPAVTPSVGVPACGVQIAKAIELHRKFLEASQAWDRWLNSRHAYQPSKPGELPFAPVRTADEFTLWKLIYELIRRRDSGGEWAQVDKSVIPKAEDLRGMLGPRYATFEAEVSSRRVRLEDAAAELADFLASPEFLAEFDQLDEVTQWGYAGDLLDGFADTWAGKAYIRGSLLHDASPMPMAHLDRVLGTNKTMAEIGNDFTAIKNFLKVLLKVAPLAIDKANFGEKVEGKWVYWIQKNFPAAVWENKKNFPNILAGSLVKLPEIDWPGFWRENSKILVNTLGAVLELVSLGYSAQKAVADPSAMNIAKLGKATLSSVKAVSSFGKQAYGETFPLAFGNTGKYLLSGPGAAFDVYTASTEMLECAKAADISDYSVASGHALQGVGLLVGAAESTGALAALEGGAVVLGLTPVGWIAVVGLVLVLGGFLLVEMTKDPPIETWLENTWFGKNWDSLTVTDDPHLPTFLVKDPDGFPRLDRQVAWWYTAFDPIQATASFSAAAKSLLITCQPRRARRGSWVTVNLFTFVDDTTESITVLSQRIDEIKVGMTRYAATYDINDSDAVVGWQCNLQLQDLTAKGLKDLDFTKCWVEVLVSAPIDGLDPAAAQVFVRNAKQFAFQARDLVLVKVEGS